MSKTMLILYLLFGILVLIGFSKITGRVKLPPGIMAPEVPRQIDLDDRPSFQHQNSTITPLADFSLQAKVLSKKRYFWGRGARLAPYDLALGWQKMSDEAILEHFMISQSNRWYRWSAKKLPISKREVINSSANMHLIPADKDVAKNIRKIKIGQIISLQGYLVRVNSPSGWYWQSSMSRKDSGSNSCEVIFVTEFTAIETDKK